MEELLLEPPPQKPKSSRRPKTRLPLLPVYTDLELAKFVKAPIRVIQAETKSGHLRATWITRRLVVYRQEDIDAWLDRCAVKPPPSAPSLKIVTPPNP